MSQTPEHLNSGPPDPIDRRLSDFFQSQMPRPWPTAPAVGATEPSEMVAVRNHAAPGGDGGGRARLTLAASVAVLLGSYWLLSNGWQPAPRNGGSHAAPGGPNIDMGKGTAGGKDTLPGEIKKAKDKDTGFTPGPIKMP